MKNRYIYEIVISIFLIKGIYKIIIGIYKIEIYKIAHSIGLILEDNKYLFINPK